jgi:hypothetical protein
VPRSVELLLDDWGTNAGLAARAWVTGFWTGALRAGAALRPDPDCVLGAEVANVGVAVVTGDAA